MASATGDSKTAAVSIGTGSTGTRTESDSLGQVEVPAEQLLRRADAAAADRTLNRRRTSKPVCDV